MNITLGPGLLEQVIGHARACYPKEGCSLLTGTRYSATRFIPMTNTIDSESEYEMDPQELVRELRSFREKGEELVAIYHSHPSAIARPSERDIARAFYPDAAHIIISLNEPEHPKVGAFRIIGREVLEIEVHAIV
jgi:proteasome lid subunit RPN8/RPN11